MFCIANAMLRGQYEWTLRLVYFVYVLPGQLCIEAHEPVTFSSDRSGRGSLCVDRRGKQTTCFRQQRQDKRNEGETFGFIVRLMSRDH